MLFALTSLLAMFPASANSSGASWRPAGAVIFTCQRCALNVTPAQCVQAPVGLRATRAQVGKLEASVALDGLSLTVHLADVSVEVQPVAPAELPVQSAQDAAASAAGVLMSLMQTNVQNAIACCKHLTCLCYMGVAARNMADLMCLSCAMSPFAQQASPHGER